MVAVPPIIPIIVTTVLLGVQYLLTQDTGSGYIALCARLAHIFSTVEISWQQFCRDILLIGEVIVDIGMAEFLGRGADSGSGKQSSLCQICSRCSGE